MSSPSPFTSQHSSSALPIDPLPPIAPHFIGNEETQEGPLSSNNINIQKKSSSSSTTTTKPTTETTIATTTTTTTSTSTSHLIIPTTLLVVPPIQETELETYNPTHLLLPHSNVYKLMKSSLPLQAKISNATKILVQECVSEFVSFISSEANQAVLDENRKTLNGVDILCALKRLGFEGYYDVLRVYLFKYRTVANQSGRRQTRHRAVEDRHAAVPDSSPAHEEDVERPSKRPKFSVPQPTSHTDERLATETNQ